MHKKISKAFAGSLMSAAMLASAVTGVLAPMSAFAGEQLGQNDFEEGAGLPWHTCESQPAKQKFDISGGTYNVTIVNNDGPESRWDLQFRHRGLKITSGHTYTVKWELDSSSAGEIYTKIGNYAGDVEVWHNNSSDFGQGWNCVPIKAGKNTFECTFTADKDVEVAEWAFHYGGKGAHQPVDCFPNDTVLKFDNMYLIDETGDDTDWDPTNEYGVVRPRTNVRTNQIGYYPFLEKSASYCTDAQEPLDFEIRDSSGKAVYTGKTSGGFEDPDSGVGETVENKYGTKKKDSGKYVHKIDFTDFQTPGEYTIFVKDTTGVSGTISGLLEGAYDTKLEGEDLVWTNPKSKLSYNMNTSYKFRIDENIYDEGLVANSINYFYQNRSGIDIESQYITSGDATTLAHQAGHKGSDEAAVQSGWTKFHDGEFTDGDTSYSIDGVGGWYDAGDHGKYVVNGGVSVWTLQNTYELSKKLGTDSKWTGDLVKIPESGDANPDILDEARYELEWMMKMIVKSDDPYWGKDYENFVYHKLHDHKWTGLATKAWDYQEEWGTKRLVKPPTYAATLNFVACAAQAARLWKGIDDTFANECLELAKTSYEAVKAKDGWKVDKGEFKKREQTSDSYSSGDPMFAPDDQAIGGGPYGDNYVQDDFYWAGCELLATTGDAEYYEDVKAYKNNNDSTGMDKAFSLTSNLGGGENKGSFSSFNWGCTSGLGTLTLYLNPDVIPDDIATVNDSITKAADAYIACMHEDTNGMGIPYRGSVFTDPNNIGVDESGTPIEVEGYEWGSNSFVINNAIVMAYAYDATKKIEYLDGAAEAMDYIFGRNGNGFSYVSGYGSHSMAHPHHRFWCNDVDPEFPMAPAGVLSGGPGAGLQDPYVGGLGYIRGTVASQKCYVDSAEAWSVNEVTINWNAPLVAMSSYMSDVASALTERADGEPSGPSTPTPSTNPSEGDPSGEVTLWGDANVDKTVTVADATLILQYLGNKDKYKIDPQGLLNADVIDNGGGVSAVDALSIQMKDANLFDASKWPMTTDEHNAIAK